MIKQVAAKREKVEHPVPILETVEINLDGEIIEVEFIEPEISSSILRTSRGVHL